MLAFKQRSLVSLDTTLVTSGTLGKQIQNRLAFLHRCVHDRNGPANIAHLSYVDNLRNKDVLLPDLVMNEIEGDGTKRIDEFVRISRGSDQPPVINFTSFSILSRATEVVYKERKRHSTVRVLELGKSLLRYL